MALKNKLDNIETIDLKIIPKITLPTTGLEDGQLNIVNGILCIYDETRGKWLSVQRSTLVFGREGFSNDQYINYCVGTLPSNTSGFRLSQNACIVSMSAQISISDECTIHFRKNNDVTNILSYNIDNIIGIQHNDINFDLDQGDYLQCYVDYTGTNEGVENIVITLELAWRL